MNTKKLKELVLDLAIHGKLVPQDPNDEPASVLLERIHAEKAKTSKGKKIVSSEVIDDVPFEVPEKWTWCSINDVCISIFAGGDKPDKCNSSKTTECRFPIYANAIQNDGLYGYTNIPVVTSPAITISARGTIGFVCVRKNPFTPIVRLITAIPINVNIDYISYALRLLTKPAEGSSIPQLTVPTFKYTFIPLPPLPEQQRIVVEIERWFKVINALEGNEGDLLKSIEQTKKKVLDLAIHGKLVPQDPNDEPASVLLERIQAEKAKTAKGKKSTASEPIGDVPFDVPEGWCWTRLGEISNYGKCESVDVKDINPTAWTLELEDIEKDSAKILSYQCIEKRSLKGVRHKFHKGEILYSKLRTYLNKVLVADKDGYCTTEIIPIKLYDKINSHYLCHVLRSKYFLDYTAMLGFGVKMPRLSTTDAKIATIPLPPLAEQQRIVAKIEEIFGELDKIKEMVG